MYSEKEIGEVVDVFKKHLDKFGNVAVSPVKADGYYAKGYDGVRIDVSKLEGHEYRSVYAEGIGMLQDVINATLEAEEFIGRKLSFTTESDYPNLVMKLRFACNEGYKG